MESTKTAAQLGFHAAATIISGGELSLKRVELTEDNLATIFCLIRKALIEKGHAPMSGESWEDYDIDLFTSEELLDLDRIFGKDGLI
jgi:hypothetical protein